MGYGARGWEERGALSTPQFWIGERERSDKGVAGDTCNLIPISFRALWNLALLPKQLNAKNKSRKKLNTGGWLDYNLGRLFTPLGLGSKCNFFSSLLLFFPQRNYVLMWSVFSHGQPLQYHARRQHFSPCVNFKYRWKAFAVSTFMELLASFVMNISIIPWKRKY